MATTRTWRYSLDLKSYELDHRGVMPAWIVYRFLQEAAEFNAVDLGFDTETLLKDNLTWMLVRLQLRVDRYPLGRCRIDVETWPSGIESRFALRDFRLYIGSQNTPFAVASSSWLLIDILKKRPVVVGNKLHPMHSMVREHVVEEPFPSVSVEGLPCRDFTFRVRRSDVDMNDHVNNVHYVEWLAESVPEEVWRSGDIAALDVEYKRAVGFGETIRVESCAMDETTYVHRMTSDGRKGDVLLARTVWARR